MFENLSAKFQAFQNQCHSGDAYIGFQCEHGCRRCRIRDIVDQSSDMIAAYRQAKPLMEAHHRDGERFSVTRSTRPEQIVFWCSDAHTLKHADEVSSSRF